MKPEEDQNWVLFPLEIMASSQYTIIQVGKVKWADHTCRHCIDEAPRCTVSSKPIARLVTICSGKFNSL
jgi:hypothetical protein